MRKRFEKEAQSAALAATASCVIFAVVILALAVCMGTVSSCSVKENRESCPCWLGVSFDQCDKVRREVTLDVSGELKKNFSREECKEIQFMQVSRNAHTVTAYECGLSGCTLEGRTVRVKDGQQMDSLYADTQSVDCRCEETAVTMRRLKQFATLRITMNKSAEQMARYSYSIVSKWAGSELETLQPAQGSFLYTPEKGGSVTQARLPRQGDDSMTLTVEYDDGTNPIKTSVKLGKLITATGYDWKAESLEDIFLTLDLTAGTARVGVKDWEDGEDQDIRHIEI